MQSPTAESRSMNGIDIDRVHTRPAASRGRPRRDIATRVLSLGRRPGGIPRSDLLCRFDGNDRDTASQALDAWLAEGSLLRFQRPATGGRGMPSARIFGTKEEGAAWIAANAAAARVVRKSPSIKPITAPPKSMQRKAPVARLEADGEVVVPAGVKPVPLPFQPTYSRHQVKPGEVVPSVVSAEQCRPWARQCLGGAS